MSHKNASHIAFHCTHPNLSFETSTHANEAGYHRATSQQRATAAGKTKKELTDDWDATFPAPLVLPGDELSMDPRCAPQSLRSWVREKERNEVTSERNVIYVAGAPIIDASVDFVRRWSHPKQLGRNSGEVGNVGIATEGVQDIADYLAAFYHGMPVKLLPRHSVRFTRWNDDFPKASKRKGKIKTSYIGLTTSTETIGIRTRPSPDGSFAGQLNLDDLLDTAISILPEDAYALLMLVDQDLYEDEDDDFCCGRAYGGSRVAVVGAARYNPILDERQGLQEDHLWPACHCEDYMKKCCDAAEKPRKAEMKKDSQQLSYSPPISLPSSTTPSPLRVAVGAYTSALPTSSSSSDDVKLNIWLPRIAQTASHELGHCFALDHCTYYACVMQATSSIVEDLRQPPYLCPVDEAKVGRATGTGERERYEAIERFCEKHVDAPTFAAFGAWVRARLGELGESDEPSAKRQRKLVSRKESRELPIERSP